VLTGYNTDVEHEGVVYHVQTEDKGLETPIILSLVYVGGAILASKRSPYDDLIAGGFDEGILALRLSRQHKLICAAVHAGRIEDLKRLGESDASEKASRRQPSAALSQRRRRLRLSKRAKRGAWMRRPTRRILLLLRITLRLPGPIRIWNH